MKNMLRNFFLIIENTRWNLSCRYHFFLFGPYGLTSVVERMPSHFLVKYLRKYGATIGDGCLIEKGISIHRPDEQMPFRNLIVGNNIYIGHKTKLDLTRKIIIQDHVLIGSQSMIWTHSSDYILGNSKPDYKEYVGDVEIGEYSIIYSGVIISCGVIIGNYVKVAAGSMVNKSLDNKCFYGGVPARFIRRIE